MRQLHTFLFAFSLFATPLAASLQLVQGEIVNSKYYTKARPERYFNAGKQCIKEKKWGKAKFFFDVIVTRFNDFEKHQEALFFLGVCDYHLGSFDLATESFIAYLDGGGEQGELALSYLFESAEQLRKGAKKHLFGSAKWPKMVSGSKRALEVYDYLAFCYPGHDYGARALFSKGLLCRRNRQFIDSLEAFQLLTHRFPNHELTADAYVETSKTYLIQGKKERRNPDLLVLSELNIRRFEEAFPQEERLEEMVEDALALREIHANAIKETAEFYERKGKTQAAALYYLNAVKRFPKTEVAEQAQKHLKNLEPALADLGLEGDEL